MSVSLDDINKVAVLARINIREQEINNVTDGINSVLGLIDKMQSVNTDNVEPLANPHDAIQRLRDDVVTATDERENLMANAPVQEQGLFLVPKVID